MMGPPLQYQSLQAILQHMDANSRSQINRQMPSIRNIEGIIPLKINRLYLKGWRTQINDTCYYLGIVRYYPEGNALRPVDKDQPWNTSEFDFDEFGFRDTSSRNILLPGDVSLVRNVEFEDELDTEEDERYYREEVRINEKALERLTELKSEGITVKEYLQKLEPLSDDQVQGEEYKIRNALKYSSGHLSSSLAKDKLALLPFDCRRNNTKSPLKYYIQLIIKKERRLEKIQRFECTKKLYEAEKHLHDVLFGNRTMPIRVGHFHFKYPEGILRLPVGFRLQANDVHVSEGSVMNRNLPVLVGNTEALDSLWMHSRWHPDQFQNQIVQKAKRLVIVDVKKNDMQELFQTIRDLPQREMLILPRRETSRLREIPMADMQELLQAMRELPHHEMLNLLPPDMLNLLQHDLLNVQWTSQFLPEDHFQIIEAWLSGNRQIGANCSIRILTENMAREILTLVRTRNEWTDETNGCVTIRRNDTTKVEVFYVPFQGNDDHSIHGEQIMKIRIVNI